MTVNLNLRYLFEDKDRHGNARVFVRFGAGKRRRKIRIREPKGTPEFLAAYTEALGRLKAGGAAGDAAPRINHAQDGSLGWLAAKYFGSEEFKALDKPSQRNRRGVIEGCLLEPLKPGSKLIIRDCPYLRFDVSHVQMLRDRKVGEGKPGAANNRRKYLGSMFSWAIEQKKFKIASNPCRDARRVKYVSGGFHTWGTEEVVTYIKRHPPGTMAYLALCLLLFLGARKQDAIRLGPKNARSGNMIYVPKKTSYVRVDESVKPILPPLAEAIRRTAIGLKTFLVTEYGKPFTDGGFGNKMREWCDQANLPECTSHGLKKIAATIVAELGATDRQMMALFDWVTERMANTYTAKANKSKMAAEAAKLLGSFAWQPVENKSEAV